MTPTQALSALARTLQQLAATLPFPRLSSKEACILGGGLFAEAPLVTESVVEALRRDAQLFPDVRADAAAIEARQERATAWKLLCAQLQGLAELARHGYLLDQAGATELALAVLRQVVLDAALPFREGPDPRQRLFALHLPLRLLAARQLRRERARAKEAGEAKRRAPRRRPGPARTVYAQLARTMKERSHESQGSVHPHLPRGGGPHRAAGAGDPAGGGVLPAGGAPVEALRGGPAPLPER